MTMEAALNASDECGGYRMAYLTAEDGRYTAGRGPAGLTILFTRHGAWNEEWTVAGEALQCDLRWEPRFVTPALADAAGA